jgi:hypothetical protein
MFCATGHMPGHRPSRRRAARQAGVAFGHRPPHLSSLPKGHDLKRKGEARRPTNAAGRTTGARGAHLPGALLPQMVTRPKRHSVALTLPLAPHREHHDHDNDSEQQSRSDPHTGHLTPPLRVRFSDIPRERDGRQYPPELTPQTAGLAPLPRILMRWHAPAVSESNLCRFMRAGSPSEERPIEPSGLRRGQAWLREQVDHFLPSPAAQGEAEARCGRPTSTAHGRAHRTSPSRA